MKPQSLIASVFISLTGIPFGAYSDQIADFRDDFQAVTPAPGWNYQWNSMGPIGSAANYTDLTWDAGATRYDVTPGNQGATPEGWLNVNANGGHPPRGTGDLASVLQDGYTIMAYTLQPGEGGHMYFSSGYRGGNTADYRVYVNDTLVYNPTPSNIFTTRQSIGNLVPGDTVYVAVGPNVNDGSDGYTTDFNLFRADPSNIVADYRADFQPNGPAAGWAYQWNSGPIGDSSQYQDLVWNATGQNYNLDGIDGFPRAEPAAWVNLTPTGGHPGRGVNDATSGGESRYAITRYTVSAADQYEIFGVVDRINSGALLDFSIYVNDSLVRNFTSLDEGGFGESLGALSPGDNIYVAVGPGLNDGGDSFVLDFAITRTVPEPSSFLLLGCGGIALMVRRLRPRA